MRLSQLRDEPPEHANGPLDYGTPWKSAAQAEVVAEVTHRRKNWARCNANPRFACPGRELHGVDGCRQLDPKDEAALRVANPDWLLKLDRDGFPVFALVPMGSTDGGGQPLRRNPHAKAGSAALLNWWRSSAPPPYRNSEAKRSRHDSQGRASWKTIRRGSRDPPCPRPSNSEAARPHAAGRRKCRPQ